MTASLAALPLLGTTVQSLVRSGDGEQLAIWDKWAAMWNGDLSVYAGAEGMAGWIDQLHAAIHPFVFEVRVQPLFGDSMIAGRWLASGIYRGGFPGAQAQPGPSVRTAGADFLRIAHGRIAEYWLSSDQLDLMTQL